jgi:hypothetical protein
MGPCVVCELWSTCDPLVLLHPQLQRQHLLTLSLQVFKTLQVVKSATD